MWENLYIITIQFVIKEQQKYSTHINVFEFHVTNYINRIFPMFSH
jgi:hypothetical protein